MIFHRKESRPKIFFSAGIKDVVGTQSDYPGNLITCGTLADRLNLVTRTTKNVIVTFEREHPLLRSLRIVCGNTDDVRVRWAWLFAFAVPNWLANGKNPTSQAGNTILPETRRQLGSRLTPYSPRPRPQGSILPRHSVKRGAFRKRHYSCLP